MVTGLAASGCELVIGIGTLTLVQDNPTGSVAGSSATANIALLTAGWLVIVVGVLVQRRRPASRSGVLLAAAGFAWFISEWNNPGADSSLVFTVGLLFYAACPPLVAPSCRIQWTAGSHRAADLMSLLSLLPGLGSAPFDPADQMRAMCHEPAAIASKPGWSLPSAWERDSASPG